MSRSCHSGMPSITGTTWARTIRARPLIRSALTGFFLCGMEDEPFWAAPNGSASSDTSVRWPCLISIAIASQTVAMSASTLTHSAMPSRSTTWVATSAGAQPELAQHLCLDSRVDIGVGADRPGQLAHRYRLPGAQQPVPAAVNREGEVGNPVPPHVRFGVDAVRPARPQGGPVSQGMLPQDVQELLAACGEQVGGLGQLQGQGGVQQVRGGHAVVHVSGGLAGRGVVRPRRQERDHVMAGDRLQGLDGLRGRRRRGRNRRDRLFRHRARPGMRGQHQGLHLAPELVLVRLAPDVAHLWQRVAVYHGLYPAASAPAGSPPGRPRVPLGDQGQHQHGRHDQQLSVQPGGCPDRHGGQGQDCGGGARPDRASAENAPDDRIAGQEECRSGGQDGRLRDLDTGAGSGRTAEYRDSRRVSRSRDDGPQDRRGDCHQSEKQRDIAVEQGAERQLSPLPAVSPR